MHSKSNYPDCKHGFQAVPSQCLLHLFCWKVLQTKKHVTLLIWTKNIKVDRDKNHDDNNIIEETPGLPKVYNVSI